VVRGCGIYPVDTLLGTFFDEGFKVTDCYGA
jgi:hypothetical protein